MEGEVLIRFTPNDRRCQTFHAYVAFEEGDTFADIHNRAVDYLYGIIGQGHGPGARPLCDIGDYSIDFDPTTGV
jgi:hypothetical protein